MRNWNIFTIQRGTGEGTQDQPGFWELAIRFHPVDESGYSFAVLEVPVVAWLDDLYRVPQESIKSIEDILSKYPGVYHFAGHTWLIRNVDYRLFVESILNLSRKQEQTGLGWSLAELASFWKSREASNFEALNWDKRSKIIKFTVNSYCNDNDLAVCMPYHWQTQRVDSIFVNGAKTNFFLQEHLGVTYAVMTSGKGQNSVAVKYA